MPQADALMAQGPVRDPRLARDGIARLRPRRGPRLEEIVLMRDLATGPRAVTAGPIGRCVKRGWCRAEVVENGTGRASTVLFGLTDAGRALIGGPIDPDD